MAPSRSLNFHPIFVSSGLGTVRALEARREQLAELERDRDTLIERYAGIVHEALDALVPEERHRVYNLLKLSVNLSTDRALEVSGSLIEVSEICKTETISRSSSTA
jgi:hypothetical protein